MVRLRGFLRVCGACYVAIHFQKAGMTHRTEFGLKICFRFYTSAPTGHPSYRGEFTTPSVRLRLPPPSRAKEASNVVLVSSRIVEVRKEIL